jgi:hypothetical protein
LDHVGHQQTAAVCDLRLKTFYFQIEVLSLGLNTDSTDHAEELDDPYRFRPEIFMGQNLSFFEGYV